ncbi:Hypothetical predicted protein [Xyrichtys novacula]|uniref:Uncharacterized protein n=1 Tax=Xyrichtys novacula TaxID=13765 RepID=A0AAV1FVW3_XYRNO|nr:Hypothetical predicted protein [Xyrichtys novacula]
MSLLFLDFRVHHLPCGNAACYHWEAANLTAKLTRIFSSSSSSSTVFPKLHPLSLLERLAPRKRLLMMRLQMRRVQSSSLTLHAMCVCVCEREKRRQGVCVCVCVCEGAGWRVYVWGECRQHSSSL